MPDAPPTDYPDAPAQQPAQVGALTPERIETILNEFRGWLQTLATVPEPAMPVPAVDLFALTGQFTALRHEVNLQTKATRSLIDQANEDRKTAEPKKAPADPQELIRPLVKSLIDVADALALGLKNVEKLQAGLQTQIDELAAALPEVPSISQPGFLARLVGATTDQHLSDWQREASERIDSIASTSERVQPLIAGLSDGYALSLRRVERVLPTFGLEQLDVAGQPFDPEVMEAVEVVDAPSQKSGTVVDEVRRGYRWNNRVFRFAQVTLAR